jgi:pimeloyl-ACP methyl ester carboxylesterase
VSERVRYDEFGLFHENAEEYGLPDDGPPAVRRATTTLTDGRRISSLVWGTRPAELVLIHGGAQNAHTWDTVAMALGRPLVAPDLPGHGHSDSPAPGVGTAPAANAADLAPVLDALAPRAAVVVGMSLGGLTAIALAAARPDLVRRLVLVDITPGVTGEKAKAIHDFVRGGADHRVQPDPLRELAPARDPPQRHAARRRLVGLASPPSRLHGDG